MVTKVRRERFTAKMPGSGNLYTVYQLDQRSTGSPVLNGRRVLRPNDFSRSEREVSNLSQHQASSQHGWIIPTLEKPDYVEFEKSLLELRNKTRSKFVRKVRSDPASLLVTAASWRQSRDMIVKRSGQLGNILDSAYNGLSGASRNRKKKVSWRREPLANQILEGTFGWAPMIQDIGSALEIVCSPLAPVWVSVASNAQGKTSGRGQTYRNERSFEQRVSLSSKVSISNPNLFLANRLGLINPGAAAWDLIPWSFLVGMFVNANQLIGSVSELVGVRLDLPSRTETTRFTQTQTEWSPWVPQGAIFSTATVTWKTKGRITTGEVIPPYSVQTRVPELNWSLAITASALLLQKAQRLNNLIKAF